MSSFLPFDLTAPGVWENIWEGSATAEQLTPNQYKAIPDIDIPLILHEPVIIVGTSSSTAPPKWRYAGEIIQRHSIPGVVSSLVAGSRHRLLLNKFNLIVFQNLTYDYRLTVDVPKWFKDYSFVIWKYTGPELNQTLETLDAMRVDLARVEATVRYFR